ncbi:LysM-like peptidoglycan-binding domain-containing protein [Actinobacillus minor]|uniref:LysM-like peptidoglycan-binding domain-containing protein n=1 Tax=Actinobacillus minor TaxID=51047 RepID=UPI0023F197E2|nr:LysM-like peptidoglycan-binding domain-containing protein [Actinobacillus minor]MDD6909616.1 LysM-like peptidoglycan-binding domain-containing protein [Actinobacillus minor]MDY4712678.1 LysM-like peptidoglycan-binding domain-containing protein [Actinobacillus minor]
MTQNNSRQEPTFGEKSVANSEQNTELEKKIVAPSLRMNHTPGHTFTPVIKPTVSLDIAPEVVKAETSRVEATKEQPSSFAFSPVTEETTKVESNVKNTAEETKSVAQGTVKVTLNAAERVIPSTSAAATSSTEKVAPASSKEKSTKNRRLGLVALLAAILGGIFFWLKPSTPETVEELQSQQGGSLPIEFRPVDEAEAQRAEAEAQAKAQTQLQAQTQTAQGVTSTEPTQMAQPSVETNTIQSAQPVEQNVSIQPVENGSVPTVQDGTQTATTDVAESPASTPAVSTVKPQTGSSVVYQPEKTRQEVRKQEVRKVEKVRPQQPQQKAQKTETQSKVKAITAAEYNAKKAQNAQMDQFVKSVEEGKVAQTAKPTAKVAPAATQTTSVVVSSKTMTVSKGISLMQVFRDNNLNISDVNAMSKVNSVVSNLKVNEKVTVRLDKNNRVVEMSIGSGGKFTRQADGSYRFK